MLDLKDQMIADQQEQRERTHEAVDDVEAYVEGQNWYVGDCHHSVCSSKMNTDGRILARRARKGSLNGASSRAVLTGALRILPFVLLRMVRPQSV